MPAQVDAPGPQWQVAECLLPGLTPEIAEAICQRVREEVARSAHHVCFLGSLLMPEDEVLLCLFAGQAAEVRAVSDQAGLPFERVVACVVLGWLPRQEAATDEPGHRATTPRRPCGGDQNEGNLHAAATGAPPRRDCQEGSRS